MRRRHVITRAVCGGTIAITLALAPAGTAGAAGGAGGSGGSGAPHTSVVQNNSATETQQHRLAYPGSVAALTGTTSAPLELKTLRGTQPVRVEASAVGPAGATGSVQIGSRIALPSLVIPATGRLPVTVPITAADVSPLGVVSVRLLQADPAKQPVCADPKPALELIDPVLVVAGRETAPTSLATFFPEVSPQVTVVVPSGAGDEVLNAGLSAVAALTRRYPTGRITMSAVVPARAQLGERAVVLAAGDHQVTTTVSTSGPLPTLAMTGTGLGLIRAAAALDSPAVVLANGPAVAGLANSRPPAQARLDQSLSQLGRERISLGGYGTSTAYLGIPQASFGRPVAQLTLHLAGVHSALPRDAAATLEVRWNDLLIGSLDLTTSRDTFAVDMTVPSSVVQGDNGMKISVNAVPAGGRCERDFAAIPFTVDIDGGQSRLTAAPGADTVTGFQRFPQTLAGNLPVALRAAGPAKVTEGIRAAAVVSALQRANRQPLTVEVVDPDAFVAGSASGLLVGASGEDTNRLQAPLRLFSTRVLSTSLQQDTLSTDQAFGAVQAVRAGGRDVLLLGGWGPAPGKDAALVDQVVARVSSIAWSGLGGDVLVATGPGEPVSLTAAQVFPQPIQVQEKQNTVWWVAGGAGVLLVLLVTRGVIGARRRREISEYVTAQERGAPGAPASTSGTPTAGS